MPESSGCTKMTSRGSAYFGQLTHTSSVTGGILCFCDAYKDSKFNAYIGVIRQRAELGVFMSVHYTCSHKLVSAILGAASL